LEPRKVVSMMDDLFDEFNSAETNYRKPTRLELTDLVQKGVHALERNKRGAIVGRNRLKLINKQVGERFTVTGINYTGLDLEFEAVGVFPPGRYDELAVMNRDYLNDALDAYPKSHGGTKHLLAEKSLDLMWLKVEDRDTYNQVSQQIESSSLFRNPAVKCQ